MRAKQRVHVRNGDSTYVNMDVNMAKGHSGA